MNNVIGFLLVNFILFYIASIIAFSIIYLIKKKKDTLALNKALKFITKKYNLQLDKKKTKKLSIILIFINSFVVSLPMDISLCLISNYYLMLLAALVMFIILMLGLYNLVGIILKKKGW